MEKEITLAVDNSISIEARGKPGGTISVVIVGVDVDLPVITAVIDPAPNSAGWNNSESVTVSFNCSDGTSGISFCSAPVVLNTEGSNQIVTGTGRDSANNVATVTVSVSIDRTAPALLPVLNPPANAFGWNGTNVTVEFSASDNLSGIGDVTPPLTLSSEGANQVVTGSSTDLAGNISTIQKVVNIDKGEPQITVTEPQDGSTATSSQISIQGLVEDSISGVESVRCNGSAAILSAAIFQCDVQLTEGINSLSIEARDFAGHVATSSLSLTYNPAGDNVSPAIDITSPANLTSFNATPVTVSGTIDDSSATVLVNGIVAPVSNGRFTASGVPLREGSNLITAIAKDSSGNVGSSGITVILDSTPPTVFISTPTVGSIQTQQTITVTGSINDVVTGTVNQEDAIVTVNGKPAQVINRSFILTDLLLKPGPNVISAVARDSEGNLGNHSITVYLQDPPAGQVIQSVSGNNQTGVIGTTLPLPLVVLIKDQQGNPVSGRPVTFAVERGDGNLTTASEQGRRITLASDAVGQAKTYFTLGTHSGLGNHRVRVNAVGFAGEVVFSASANPGPPAAIRPVLDMRQRGIAGSPLAEPFLVVVTDFAGNPLNGIPVTFEVTEGAGNINGESLLSVNTNDDGRASIVLTPGPEEGTDNNTLVARFDGMSGNPVAFVASAVRPGRVEDTKVSGIVVDNTDVPIQGVTARIKGTTLQAVTDDQGQFTIVSAPVGAIHLEIDGTTALRAGEWPHLEFELNTIAGQNNTVEMPIYLLPLDTENSKIVGGTQDVTLTMKDVPGFSLTVFANSATFADGSRVGRAMVTQVHFDKVPMPPISGAAPRLTWTVQPAGARFDPPARLSYPNLYGLKPGAVVDIFSFDHDLGEFVSMGNASVSEDGSIITSDPGVGIRKAGWGYLPAPTPPPGCLKNVAVRILGAPDTLEIGQLSLQASGSLDKSDAGCPESSGLYEWSVTPSAIATFPFGNSDKATTVDFEVGGEAVVKTTYTTLSDAGSHAASASEDVVVIPSIEQEPRKLWHFQGEPTPPGFMDGDTEVTLTATVAEPVGNFRWIISQGSNKVDFENGSDEITKNDTNTVSIRSTCPSNDPKDVEVTLIHIHPEGRFTHKYKLEVRTPSKLVPQLRNGKLYNDTGSAPGCDAVGTDGYKSVIVYEIQTQLDEVVTNIGINEARGQRTDVEPNDWGFAEAPNGFFTETGSFEDKTCFAFAGATPQSVPPPPPGTPLSVRKIFFLTQMWRYGSTTSGTGHLVQTNDQVYYIDHGRHENVINEGVGCLP